MGNPSWCTKIHGPEHVTSLSRETGLDILHWCLPTSLMLRRHLVTKMSYQRHVSPVPAPYPGLPQNLNCVQDFQFISSKCFLRTSGVYPFSHTMEVSIKQSLPPQETEVFLVMGWAHGMNSHGKDKPVSWGLVLPSSGSKCKTFLLPCVLQYK